MQICRYETAPQARLHTFRVRSTTALLDAPLRRHSVALPDAVYRSMIESVVSAIFTVEPRLLQLPTRGVAGVAFARQVAMYLAHVAFGLSFTDIGRIFGRDRTTVAHACAVIEDRRDNRRLDRALDLLVSSLDLMLARD